MVTEVVFGDEIVNPTDLRKHQREWLERAYDTPVTIRFGGKNLAIIRRDKIGAVYKIIDLASKVIAYSAEVHEGREANSKIFPWVRHLDKDERTEFLRELLDTFQEAADSEDWRSFETMLDGWKATAEAESNPETLKALLLKERKEDYVRLEVK